MKSPFRPSDVPFLLVLVLLQSASAIVAQDVGSHVLRIDGYSYTKTLGNGKFITSASFTVGGHRWCLNYYPNGMSESYSDWISVYLCLDNTEVNEVRAKFTISLLDKEGNPVPSYIRHCAVTRTYSAKASNGEWGYPEVMRRSDLEGSPYLKDDVFSLRCDITVPKEIFITKAIPVSAVHPGDMKQE
ncbi:hypothetical protein ZWY2020_001361 [Hordeum vulgare]|nr:hypothetical protein ZWY2020_001361 [Hordeum vulgare]